MNSAEFGAEDLVFLPLGGSGEIGMNLNLYGYRGKWLIVDLGVTFHDDRAPGAEVVMPDPTFIEERRDDLLGIVLTHAHEDHLGAVPYLWPRLRCPVWATGFAASVLKRKLEDVGLEGRVPLTEIAPGDRVTIGPFDVELIHITHSIPESNALAIRTPSGIVMHTGDWKLDPDPLVGPVTQSEAICRAGAEGVLALVGDSTNAMVEGHTRSEADVRRALGKLFADRTGRIVVACFASNIARLDTIAAAARAVGRDVGLVGRSLWRMHDAAKENGYLAEAPRFLDEFEAGYVPRERIVLICTGSQGESRAALARIAADTHPHIALDADDVAVFSSRIIPGNEVAVGRLQNALVRLGVQVINADDVPEPDGPIHVSGHPARAELVQMYQWVRPHIAIPVHGEARHMHAHAELARGCQVPHAYVPANGDIVRISPDGPELVGQVQSGRWALDGERLVPIGGPVLRGRNRMAAGGALFATVIVDRRGQVLGKPQVSAPGLVDGEAPDRELLDDVADAIVSAVKLLRGAGEDETVREAAARAARKVVKQRYGRPPVVEVHVVRAR